MVTSPHGKSVTLIGVGDENGETTNNIAEWYQCYKGNWCHKMLNQTLKVARKGAVVFPIPDELTDCSK